MSKKKGGNYWRNLIKAEKNKNKRFRGRFRSKGDTAVKKGPSGKKAPKSGKWAQKIRAEQKSKSTGKDWRSKVNPVKAKRAKKASTNKKLAKLRGNIRKARRNAQLKGRQAFPNPTIKKSQKLITTKVGGKITQSVGNKQVLDSLKKKQSVVKVPKTYVQSKGDNIGISQLKNVALKNKPVKIPVKTNATPSKGATLLKAKINKPAIPKALHKSQNTPSKGAVLLKKNVSKIVNKPKEIKRVKQPVIKRGR